MKSYKFLLILFIIVFSGNTLAQFGSVGLTTGLAVPHGSWGPGFSTSLFSNLNMYYKDLIFQPHLDFHTSGYSAKINNSNTDLSLLNFGLGINILKIVHTFGKGKAIFAGAGLNYNIINSDKIRDSYDSNEEEVFSDTDTKLGLALVSSYMHKFSQFAGFAEIKYTYIQDNHGFFNIAIGAMFFIR